MPFELPLFPLNTVLFPGMQLPLHIFEPRYRLMMRRCLEADRTFGVAMIVEGEAGESNTVPVAAGCTAEILEATPFPDGRMNIQSVGRRRFRVLAAREEDGYMIGTVEWLDDEPDAASVSAQAIRVRRAAQHYLTTLARNAHVTNLTTDDIDFPADPYALSMWVAALITLPLEQKQDLLERTSTGERLDLEQKLLCCAEIVQIAFARRAQQTTDETLTEEFSGPYSQFLSLN